jgi:hypothetical protein
MMKYIKQTMNHGLCYKSGGKFEVEGYCDSEWAGEKLTRKSTSGYIFCLAGAAISWSPKRQALFLLKLALNQMAITCSDVTKIDVSDAQQMSQMADLNGSDSASMSPPPPSSSRSLVSVI